MSIKHFISMSNMQFTDGSRILEFADGLNLVIYNTLFTKQEAKLVTYVAGQVKSSLQLIILWFGRRTKPRFVTSR